MTNEEKAKELYQKWFDFETGGCVGELLLEMAEWKDEQSIISLGGWNNNEPDFDCFCLVKTIEFPKNCKYVVAEWDNNAKSFYSESSDYPIKNWEKWKLIERQ